MLITISLLVITCIDITLNQIGNVFHTLFGNIDTLPAVPVIDTIISMWLLDKENF